MSSRKPSNQRLAWTTSGTRLLPPAPPSPPLRLLLPRPHRLPPYQLSLLLPLRLLLLLLLPLLLLLLRLLLQPFLESSLLMTWH